MPPNSEPTPSGDDAIRRAEEARVLIGNTTLKDAFDRLRAAILAQWATSPIRDEEGQRYLRLMLQATDDMWRSLERFVADGKLTKVNVDRKNKLQRMIDS